MEPRVRKVKIFADGADLAEILELSANPLVSGFTTNPTLMRKVGVEDYKTFVKQVIDVVPTMPVSFEVISDEFDEMRRQARVLAACGDNVYVKIPVTNTHGESSSDVISDLTADGLSLNVTAVTTLNQVEAAAKSLLGTRGAIISVFAGRIADTGLDPGPIMRQAVQATAPDPNLELLWASPREVLNLRQAEEVGCQIITLTHDLLHKIANIGRDLEDVSIKTVQMFYRDALASRYSL